MAIPSILLAIALITLTRPGLGIVIAAIVIPEVPRIVRVVRSVVLSIRAPALCRERDRRRHAQHQAARAPHPAQHAGAADRAGDLRVRLGHADRGRPVVPRRRRAAGDPELGQHHRPGAHLLPDRAVEHLHPRRVPRRHRARGQHAGRRPARPPRSATGEAACERTWTLLQVRDLRTHFFTADGVVRAVDGVSFDLAPARRSASSASSGCGKSVTALSILRLIAPETGRIVGGSIRFDGQELTTLLERGDARAARPQNRDDLPGADDQPQSRAHHRHADRRERGAAHAGSRWRAALRPRARDARAGAHRRCPPPPRPSTRTSSPAACASAS